MKTKPNEEPKNVQEPTQGYNTNSFVDVMMMLYSMPISKEVKRHVGQRLVEEAEASHLAEAFERVNHLATLKRGWDGEGALPIAPATLDNIKKVLLISTDNDWKDWMIGPDTNATIGLQAKTTDAFISLGSEEFSYYAFIDGKEHHGSHVKFTPLAFLNIMHSIS